MYFEGMILNSSLSRYILCNIFFTQKLGKVARALARDERGFSLNSIICWKVLILSVTFGDSFPIHREAGLHYFYPASINLIYNSLFKEW